MKKKLIAALLLAVMLLGMVVPASAAVSTDYAMEANLQTGQTGADCKLTLSLKAKDIVSGQMTYALFAVDKTVLTACGDGGSAPDSVNGLAGAAAGFGFDSAATTYFQDKAYKFTPEVFLQNAAAGNMQYVWVKLKAGATYNDAFWSDAKKTQYNTAKYPIIRDTLTTVVDIYFKLASGKTKNDISKQTFRVMSLQELVDTNAPAGGAAQHAVSASEMYTYNKIVKSGGTNSLPASNIDTMGELVVKLDGGAMPAGPATPLSSITFDLNKNDTTDKVTVNGTTGGTVTVSNARPVPADAELGTVTYTVSPSAGITVNGTTITVGPKAAAGQYTVTGKSSNNNKTGTKTFTVERAPAELTKFTASVASNSVKVPASGNKNTSGNVTFVMQDQYDANIGGGTPTATTLPTGVTYEGGKLAVSDAASVANNQSVTFSVTIGSVTKTANATISVTTGDGPAAPTGLGKTDAAAKGQNGSLTGTTDAMEYSTNKTNWSPCSNGSTAVPAGSYYVRYKATAKYAAGAATTTALVVEQPGTSKTPSVSVTPAGPVEYTEGTPITLTAAISGTGVNEANCTIKWYKDGGEINGETGNTLSVSAIGTYKCVVTNTDGANDPATGNSNEVVVKAGKTKAAITVVKKAGPIAKFKTGAVSAIKLTDIADVKADGTIDAKAAGKLEATIVAYEIVTTPGANEGDPATVEYKAVDTLEASKDGEKTYLLGYSIKAWAGDADYAAFSAVAAPSVPAAEADEANFVKVTVAKKSSGGGGASGYTVTYVAGDKGTLTGSATETVYGGTPKNVPTVTAKAGYTFKGWSLDGKTVVDPKTVTITESVTFTALYNDDNECYIKGYGNGLFLPKNNVTRAEVATMLAKLSAEFDKDEQFTVANKDIKAGDWYEAFMKYAVKTGMITGDDQGNYRPESYITRGEFAKMLATYLKLDLTSGAGAAFGDVSGWAATYANALKKAGITKGYEDGLFRQNNRLTREEAVAMINRAVKLSATAGETYKNNFNDVTNDSWAYGDIMAAANTPISKILSK